MPQENYPLTSADLQPRHRTEPTPATAGPSRSNGIGSACAGANHTVHVTDPGFLNAGGSPYEGQDKPLCDAKLITTRGNQTVAPNFNLFTDVPLPTHFWGLTINDLGLARQDPGRLRRGPGHCRTCRWASTTGAGRLVDTVLTDHNGMYEATEPSTSSYNCPLPAGPCPGMYYFKGNDPGQPGRPNEDYNPRFRTIGTDFQAWPGLFTVTDTAPTQTSAIAITPDGAIAQPVICDVNAGVTDPAKATPDIYAVSDPYMKSASTPPPSRNIGAQTLAVSSITTTGAASRTARLTVTGLDTTALPPTITLNLTTTNTPGMNATLRNALNGTHPVTDIFRIGSATTITYSFTTSILTPNVTGFVPVGLSATTPAFSTTSTYHAGQQVTATAVATAGTTTAKTVTLTVPTDTVDTSVQWPSVSLPLTGLPNVGLAWTLLLAGAHANPTVTAHTIAFPVTTNQANVSAGNAGFPVTLPSFSTQATGSAVPKTVTISGSGFGSTAGTVALTPATGTSNVVANVTSWSDTKITVSVTSSDGAPQQPGVYQLSVTGSNGRVSVNGLSFHILGTGYNPTLFQVNPDATHGADSAGRNFGYRSGGTGTWDASVVDDQYDASGAMSETETSSSVPSTPPGPRPPSGNSTAPAPLVVVWPKDADRTPSTNATGDYYESLVIRATVKLQGVGPGGFQARHPAPTSPARVSTASASRPTPSRAQWINTVTAYGLDPATVPDGARHPPRRRQLHLGRHVQHRGSTANRVRPSTAPRSPAATRAAPGWRTRTRSTVPTGPRSAAPGAGHPGRRSSCTAGATACRSRTTSSWATAVPTAAASGSARPTPRESAHRLHAVELGEHQPAPDPPQPDHATTAARTSPAASGSSTARTTTSSTTTTSAATSPPSTAAAVSHYGLSDGGQITFNRVYLNQSYDEGGGVMVAGELNPEPQPSPRPVRRLDVHPDDRRQPGAAATWPTTTAAASGSSRPARSGST